MVKWGGNGRRTKSGIGLYPREVLLRIGGNDYKWAKPGCTPGEKRAGK